MCDRDEDTAHCGAPVSVLTEYLRVGGRWPHRVFCSDPQLGPLGVYVRVELDAVLRPQRRARSVYARAGIPRHTPNLIAEGHPGMTSEVQPTLICTVTGDSELSRRRGRHRKGRRRQNRRRPGGAPRRRVKRAW